MNYNKDHLQQLAIDIRISTLKTIHLSGASHIGSCLSAIDILTYLYFHFLKVDAKQPKAEARDRFILSKGHAAAALYATLAKKEFFPSSWLDSYCCKDAKLSGHATHTSAPGVEISTGSLGHGLPIGIGMARQLKLRGSDQKVVVMLSDGECQEGSNWEAFLMAPHLKLDNLIVIVDKNQYQAYGKTEEILPLGKLADKLSLFGWQSSTIDGHDFDQIHRAFSEEQIGCPKFIVAETVKGKGVSYMEGSLAWHYKCPNKEQLEQAIKELEVSR